MRASYVTNYTTESATKTPVLKKDFAANLDVRAKMLISFSVSLAVIPLYHIEALAILLTVSLAYLLSIRRFWITLVAYITLAFLCGLAILSSFMVSHLFPNMKGLTLATFILPFIRIAILLNVILVMAMTSRVQGMLQGLKSLRLPYFIYLPAAVMIRFIPVFIKDVSQIKDSLKTKGYDIRPVFVCLHPFFTVRLLFVPLVIRALRSADELGIAAELKGVGLRDNISHYRKKQLGKSDYVVLLLTLVILAVAFGIQYGFVS